MGLFLFFIAVSVSLLPNLVQADFPPNIWEGTSGGGCNVSQLDAAGRITNTCTFCDGLIVIRNIVNLLFQIAIPLAVLGVTWGAIMLGISGGNESKIRSAKDTMKLAIIGLIIALCAWLIVNTILQLLTGNPNFPWATLNCE